MTSLQKLTVVACVLAATGCKDMGTDPQPVQSTTPPAQTVSFAQNVLPLFQHYGCASCHGGNGGLVVSSVASLLVGGDHGAAIVPGQAENSNLIKKLSSPPPFGARMPQGGPYLPDTTIAVLRAWINQGALNN